MSKIIVRHNLYLALSQIIIFCLIILLGTTSLASAQGPQNGESKPGRLVVIRPDFTYTPHRVEAPFQKGQPTVKTATINVTYTGFSPAAQVAFQRAVDIWESLITSSIPIQVQANWTPLGPGVLGSAGATTVHRNFTNAPTANVWFPAALANARAGTDLNGGTVEINANFNSNFANWYLGTDANPGPFEFDLTSVVMHELGHGLGFFGSEDYGGGQGSLSFSNFYLIYDIFIEDGNGTKLTTYPTPSTSLGNAFVGAVGGGVFFSGPNANVANGNSRVKLYTPSIFEEGSSISHLDEDTFNETINALMTPQIGNGEALHNPGPVTLGMFQDMGWSVVTGPDLSLAHRLVGSDQQPGDPVAFNLIVKNVGTSTATNVVLENIIPSGILTPTWSSSSGGITEQAGSPFTWDLPNLAPEASLTVNVFGTLDPGLPSNFAIINSATVSTTDIETVLENNTSLVIVGGTRVFLPNIIK